MTKLTENEMRELWVLLHLREALGDPTGKLMQDELVERARNAWADAQRYKWHKARNPSGLLATAWAASKAACEIGDDPDAATDVAMLESK